MRGQAFGRTGNGAIQRLRALGAAEHQEHAGVVGEAEELAGLRAQRGPVECGDRLAHRDPDDLAALETRIRHRGQHPARRAGADLVGPARAGVGLVHHDRNGAATAQSPAAGGEVGRQRDVTAEPHDDVGLDGVENVTRLADRGANPQWQPSQVGRRLARQRNRGDQLEVVATFGDQPGFQPAGRAEGGDPDVGPQRHQRVGNRHRGLDVTCGAAAGQHHGDAASSAVAPLAWVCFPVAPLASARTHTTHPYR
ncbi:Uncharacterised protein [Mycobacteroides abscessus subsp. abscessus]|nr:Uncharacterised protein [Mycobacteroides abscessus subsp. abscessus]